MSYSPMRIGGLVSGMDIDQIVSDLMKAERTRVDKLYQQKQIMEWQKADYRDINLKLRSLYNTSFDMKLSNSYLKYKAVGTMNDGAGFSKYFSVSPGASAVPGDYKVEVQQIASYARLESSKAVTKPLTGAELSGQIEITDGSKFSVTIDGVKKTVELDAGNYDTSNADDLEALAQDLEKAINTAFGWQGDGNGDTISGIKRVQVNIQNNRLTIQPAEDFHKVPITLNAAEGDTTLSTLGFADGAAYSPLKLNTSLKSQISGSIEGGTISFNINGKAFEFDSNASLQTILDKINTTADIGVTARYDTLTDKVVLTSKETGLGAKIEITEDSGLFNALGFNAAEAVGQNARIVLNNTVVEKSANDFTVNGMSFSLKETMETGKAATFRLENDADAAVESIKKYVELYNETIDMINGKLSEERYRKFPPLTDEQKSAMSENDIKLWEEKAKSGLLRSDSLLDGIVRKLRSAVSTPVSGLAKGMNTLSAIGITTNDWKEKGKLYIDEEKLRDAVTMDLEGVMKLFNASGDDFSSQGVATRFYDILKGGIQDITEKAGGGEYQIYDDSILGKQIRDMEDRILNLEEKLVQTEERYWQKFTAMEQAIQYANQQSMWLSMQFNMYTGS
ncbi:flagellar filament capping protein FliD [Tepidanaerobacter sp. EBM-38]|uniref:flagellar filament capping protein FliD n=1 Tax=Tepidanaerobacter sp. EBM-38 TaxID=1918496 RepID=UPI000B25123E|nr:flagellar filament capping protein FliD [Tepidanaerobacter sp. EBM-38]